MHAGLLSYRLDDVTLADPAPAHQDQVGVAPDEIARGELFDLHAVEGFGVELPVESLQNFLLRKVRFAYAARHPALAAGMSLGSQQLIQELQMGQALFLRPGQ